MGISADLIKFTKNGKSRLTDLNDQTLYEFFPESFHDLIYEITEEIYDLDYYRQLYNNPNIRIHGYGYERDIIVLTGREQPDNPTDQDIDDWYADLIEVESPKTLLVKCNAINYDTIGYIGNKDEFKKNIFSLYNKRLSYPSLWRIQDNIIKDKKSWVNEYKDDPFVFIELNY